MPDELTASTQRTLPHPASTEAQSSPPMLVSIIIPVRNAAPHIVACLGQLRTQDYPHDRLEVIVVDGASTDGTGRLASTCDLGGIRLEVIALRKTGRAAGINAGIRTARGGAICRLDVRTRISPDYVRLCTEVMLATNAANVGGLQVPEGRTPAQSAIALAMAHPFGVGNAQFRIAKKSGYVDTIYPGFYRRSIFEKVGWFDERTDLISEDSDFNQRIRAAGERIYLDVRIRAGYEPRASLSRHARLYYHYGAARAGNLRKHGRMTSWRQLVAPLLVAVLAGLLLTSVVFASAGLALGGLLAIYSLVDVGVSLYLSARPGRWRGLPVLLLAFPAMHLAWGLGFWHALLLPSTRNHNSEV